MFSLLILSFASSALVINGAPLGGRPHDLIQKRGFVSDASPQLTDSRRSLGKRSPTTEHPPHGVFLTEKKPGGHSSGSSSEDESESECPPEPFEHLKPAPSETDELYRRSFIVRRAPKPDPHHAQGEMSSVAAGKKPASDTEQHASDGSSGSGGAVSIGEIDKVHTGHKLLGTRKKYYVQLQPRLGRSAATYFATKDKSQKEAGLKPETWPFFIKTPRSSASGDFKLEIDIAEKVSKLVPHLTFEYVGDGEDCTPKRAFLVTKNLRAEGFISLRDGLELIKSKQHCYDVIKHLQKTSEKTVHELWRQTKAGEIHVKKMGVAGVKIPQGLIQRDPIPQNFMYQAQVFDPQYEHGTADDNIAHVRIVDIDGHSAYDDRDPAATIDEKFGRLWGASSHTIQKYHKICEKKTEP